MQQWKEARRNYLAALIQHEIAKILETAGLGRSARVGSCCAALGCSFGQVWARARERVLEQILRQKRGDMPRQPFLPDPCDLISIPSYSSKAVVAPHHRDQMAVLLGGWTDPG
jgi:hypothetical protein